MQVHVVKNPGIFDGLSANQQTSREAYHVRCEDVKKFSPMAFLHLLGTSQDHSIDINDVASPLPRKIVFQKIISNFARHFESFSTEVS